MEWDIRDPETEAAGLTLALKIEKLLHGERWIDVVVAFSWLLAGLIRQAEAENHVDPDYAVRLVVQHLQQCMAATATTPAPAPNAERPH